MRIMLIDHYAGSVYHGMEFRPYYMAREWVKSGNEVVITAADFSHLRRVNPHVGHGFLKRGFTKEDIDGITYLWVKTPEYHGNGLKRALNMAEFYRQMKVHAKKIAREFSPEAVIASSTYPFDIYLAARIAELSGGRFYFEIHDLWPLTQIELYGMKATNPYVKLLQKAEDYAFKNARRVISVLPQAYIHMEERGASIDKFVYVPNGVVPQKEEISAPDEVRQKIGGLKSAGNFIVMYLGGFATANALEDFVDAARLVGGAVMLVLVGDGIRKPELVSRTAGCENILFLDSVQKTQVQGVLSLADCLYLGAKRCGLYRYGVGMNKLYDYMLAAKPVICGIDASNDEVAESGCGVTIPPQNPQAIADAVRLLMSKSEDERRKMGENGRKYVLKNHNYKMLAQKFLDALTDTEDLS